MTFSPGAARPQDLDFVTDRLRELNHDDGVGVRWQHAAGVDQQRFAGADVGPRRFAHCQLAAQLQESRQRLAGAESIGRPQRVAIDCALAKSGRALGRMQVSGEDAAEGVGGRNGLRARLRLPMRVQQRQGLSDRCDLEELGRGHLDLIPFKALSTDSLIILPRGRTTELARNN